MQLPDALPVIYDNEIPAITSRVAVPLVLEVAARLAPLLAPLLLERASASQTIDWTWTRFLPIANNYRTYPAQQRRSQSEITSVEQLMRTVWYNLAPDTIRTAHIGASAGYIGDALYRYTLLNTDGWNQHGLISWSHAVRAYVFATEPFVGFACPAIPDVSEEHLDLVNEQQRLQLAHIICDVEEAMWKNPDVIRQGLEPLQDIINQAYLKSSTAIVVAGDWAKQNEDEDADHNPEMQLWLFRQKFFPTWSAQSA